MLPVAKVYNKMSFLNKIHGVQASTQRGSEYLKVELIIKIKDSSLNSRREAKGRMETCWGEPWGALQIYLQRPPSYCSFTTPSWRPAGSVSGRAAGREQWGNHCWSPVGDLGQSKPSGLLYGRVFNDLVESLQSSRIHWCVLGPKPLQHCFSSLLRIGIVSEQSRRTSGDLGR